MDEVNEENKRESPKDIWSDDVLGRKEFAEKVERVIQYSSEPIVINISSPYGTGKTFFMSRFLEQLKALGHTCVYVDTWSSDFQDDPLFVLFGELTAQLLEIGIINKKGT